MIIFLLIALLQNEIRSDLIDNLTKFTYKEKNYFYVNDFLSWTDAVKACKSYGGELTTINSKAENDYIGNFLCEVHGNCNNWDVGVWIGCKAIIIYIYFYAFIKVIFCVKQKNLNF